MNNLARTSSMLLVPVVAITLAACGGGSRSVTEITEPGGIVSEPAATPAASDTPAASGVAGNTACMIGAVWLLDVNDSARQVGELLASNGLEVISTEGTGRHAVVFTGDGLVSSNIDVSITVTAAVSADMVMTMVQTQSGVSGGEWYWQADTADIAFESWENGDYQIQTQTFINDVATPVSTAIPDSSWAGTSLTVLECSPTELVTQATGSPFTNVWHSES